MVRMESKHKEPKAPRTKKKPNRGPRPTPTGLRPQHPERGGTEGGNAQQHETQAAAQEQTESDVRAPKRTHTSLQAQRRPPLKHQRREQRRQLRSTQHHAGSGNSPARRRKDPGARASLSGCIHKPLQSTRAQKVLISTKKSRRRDPTPRRPPPPPHLPGQMGHHVPLPAAAAPASLPDHSVGSREPTPPKTRRRPSHAALALIGQPDPRIVGFNPTATRLQLHVPLREGGFGVREFLPPVCAASCLSTAARSASALSTAAHLHPFSAPTSASSASWYFLHSQFPELCPSPAAGFTAVTAHSVAHPSPPLP
jgi:hypothetical protein